MDRDWNSCALACRWAHSVQNSSSNVAITSVEHKPLPPRFVLYFSYKMEVPATTPPCILLRCLRPIQLSGSISWTPTKTCSRRKSFSLTGESLIPTWGLRTPVCFLLESKSFENAEESSYLSPFHLIELSLLQRTPLWEQPVLFMSSALPLGSRTVILKSSNT